MAANNKRSQLPYTTPVVASVSYNTTQRYCRACRWNKAFEPLRQAIRQSRSRRRRLQLFGAAPLLPLRFINATLERTDGHYRTVQDMYVCVWSREMIMPLHAQQQPHRVIMHTLQDQQQRRRNRIVLDTLRATRSESCDTTMAGELCTKRKTFSIFRKIFRC